MYSRLLNQAITRYPKTGYSSYGDTLVSSGISENARVELKQKRRLLPNGNVVVVEGKVFLDKDSQMGDEDIFTYDDVRYRVYAIYKVPGANGQVHHIEAEFVKSQAS